MKNTEHTFREKLIEHLTKERGYPLSLAAKELHLRRANSSSEKAPKGRRSDLIFYHKAKGGTLCPLLLIECKAKIPTPADLHQLLGYNRAINAPFIALTSPQALFFGKADGTLKALSEWPPYVDLVKSL